MFENVGRPEEAQESYQEALAIAREVRYPQGEIVALVNLGNTLLRLGRLEDARVQLRQALTLARELGNQEVEAAAALELGRTSFSLGRYGEAIRELERALALVRKVRSPRQGCTSGCQPRTRVPGPGAS